MRTAWTNGCFDLLHPGHVEFLTKCKKMADYVVVFMNSDKSVRSLKGPSRPIMNEEHRKSMLLTMGVGYVMVFDELDACRIISELAQAGSKPDMYIRASDADLRHTPEGALMLKLGVPLVMLPMVSTLHTSDIVARIKASDATGSVSGS